MSLVGIFNGVEVMERSVGGDTELAWEEECTLTKGGKAGVVLARMGLGGAQESGSEERGRDTDPRGGGAPHMPHSVDPMVFVHVHFRHFQELSFPLSLEGRELVRRKSLGRGSSPLLIFWSANTAARGIGLRQSPHSQGSSKGGKVSP